jgi:hypothetical protein
MGKLWATTIGSLCLLQVDQKALDLVPNFGDLNYDRQPWRQERPRHAKKRNPGRQSNSPKGIRIRLRRTTTIKGNKYPELICGEQAE